MVRGLNITVDYYNIKIKDRITLTVNLQGQDIRDALTKAGLAGWSGRYFRTCIDTRTKGPDVVASSRRRAIGVGGRATSEGSKPQDTQIHDGHANLDLTPQRHLARTQTLRLTPH